MSGKIYGRLEADLLLPRFWRIFLSFSLSLITCLHRIQKLFPIFPPFFWGGIKANGASFNYARIINECVSRIVEIQVGISSDSRGIRNLVVNRCWQRIYIYIYIRSFRCIRPCEARGARSLYVLYRLCVSRARDERSTCATIHDSFVATMNCALAN